VGDILEDNGTLFRVEMLGLSRLEEGHWVPASPQTRTWKNLAPPREEQ
jgi:hypothetical protein